MAIAPFMGLWRGAIREVGPYLDLGMRLALLMTAGVLIGYWVDRRLHTVPLFLILGFLIGAFSGFWSIYRTVYKSERKKSKPDA